MTCRVSDSPVHNRALADPLGLHLHDAVALDHFHRLIAQHAFQVVQQLPSLEE